ncbi:hypothetical protein SNE40_002916 [Patella caerulea]|uniref:Uncharacterized protein n=1 Tax=Patella caerulea TaxID=87958 RepID=A0AAN8PZS4_PATCE
MSGKECLNAIQDREHVFLESPPGDKSNMWFLVDNKDNLQRQREGKHMTYYDDCGVWDSGKGRCHSQDYLSGNLGCVFKRDGEYCERKRVGGKTVFIPLVPQPTDIITMHRLETATKLNPTFKKHVSYFTQSSNPILSDIAVYEYCGTQKVEDKARTNPNVL